MKSYCDDIAKQIYVKHLFMMRSLTKTYFTDCNMLIHHRRRGDLRLRGDILITLWDCPELLHLTAKYFVPYIHSREDCSIDRIIIHIIKHMYGREWMIQILPNNGLHPSIYKCCIIRFVLVLNLWQLHICMHDKFVLLLLNFCVDGSLSVLLANYDLQIL
uniref:Uncharacterized protein n=1 Tax=Hordeum vulgare subsp. vulgare TaxID=112509 RepID=A0A8I6YNE9_HORVV